MNLEKLRQKLTEDNKFPYVIFDLKNIKYLSNFTGSNAILIINHDKNIFFTDTRYELYVKQSLSTDYQIVIQRQSDNSGISEYFKENKIKEAFIESSKLTLDNYILLKESNCGIEFIPTKDYLKDIRMQKTENEIEVIQKSVDIADSCFSHLLKYIKPGISEWDIFVEIDYFYKTNNCKRSSFDSIVACGAGAAMPHYEPSKEVFIKNNSVLMIDMGCEFSGYCSDITRTVFIGSIPEKFDQYYNIVLGAQLEAIEKIKSGITTGEVDKSARDYISQNGYGDYFTHSLGHGVGLDVHEMPYLKKYGETVIPENSIVTIEPGIYFEGVGGIRIEDMVIVKDNGAKIMTKSSKEIIIL